jgi:hypothetical protein
MREDYWLMLAFRCVAVFSREHVHFPLVHPKLADISLKKKDIGTLKHWNFVLGQRPSMGIE